VHCAVANTIVAGASWCSVDVAIRVAAGPRATMSGSGSSGVA